MILNSFQLSTIIQTNIIMNYILNVINNLNLLDYIIISFLFFLTSSNDFFLPAKIERSLSLGHNNSTKIIILHFTLPFIAYLTIAIISYFLHSVLLLILIFATFLFYFNFSFISYTLGDRFFNEHKNTFFQNAISSLSSGLLNVAIYILIVKLILPVDKLMGILLMLLYIIPKIVLLFLPLTPSKLDEKHIKKRLFFLTKSLFLLVGPLSVVLTLVFSFSFSIKYKSDFEGKIVNDINIRSIQQNIRDFEKSTNDLSLTLSKLVISQKLAQDKLDTLQLLLSYINQDVENIALKKMKLEEKVALLQNKSDSEIRKDAIFMAISDVINKNQYLTLILSLIIGIITGLVANFLFMKITRDKA